MANLQGLILSGRDDGWTRNRRIGTAHMNLAALMHDAPGSTNSNGFQLFGKPIWTLHMIALCLLLFTMAMLPLFLESVEL